MILLLAFGLAAQAATFTVTTNADSGAGSLREAITSANAAAGADTIDATGISGTIQLGSALPAINDQLTLVGPGANLLTVRGNGTNAFDAFIINGGKTADFSGLTVSNADAGIFNNRGTVTLANCALSGNRYGIYNIGLSTSNHCTLSSNSYGILNATAGKATFANCTFSGNNEGVSSGDEVTLTNCTISGNTSGISIVPPHPATLKNSLVAGNATNINGSITDGGGNRIGGTAAAAGLDPNGLQYNGGPTRTIALLIGSPAINAGDNALIPSGITTDQRGTGFPRILAGRVDIGAFESNLTPLEFLVVTTTADEDNGTYDPAFGTGTSLREALNVANGTAGAHAITFAIPDAQKANGIWTIQLSSALLVTSVEVTLTGPGADLLAVRGNGTGSFSAFTIDSGRTANFSGLTVSNAVYGIGNNNGTANVTNCTLSGNSRGISNYNGTANVTNCTFSGNPIGINSTAGTETLTNCTLSGNSYGILSDTGTEALTNCTLSGNSTGIFNSGGTATLTHCTLSGNTDGINSVAGAAATLKNSVVAGNETNITGGFADGGNNITSGTAAQAGLDPNGLQDNGGPTKTIALVAGSPAIDMGSNANVPSGVTTDQRGAGFPRIISGTVDIGAFEVQDTTPVNQNPIAGPDTIMRYPNLGVNVPIATLLSNDTDPDGDTPLSITAFSSPTPGGGTVTTDGTLVYYTPAPGFTAADSFTYTLIDGQGGTATGVVTVEIIPDDDQSNRITKIEMRPDGTVGLAFSGIPGSAYRIQSNDSLTPQNWRDRATLTADVLGHSEFIDDEDPLPPVRFYRSVSP